MPLGAGSFEEGFRMGVEGLPHLEEGAAGEGEEHGGGGRRGFAPDLGSNEEAVEVVLAAIERAGVPPRRGHGPALDARRHRFHEKGSTSSAGPSGERRDRAGDDRVLEGVDREVPHPLHQRTDSRRTTGEGWRELTAQVGDRVQLVGDDLFSSPTCSAWSRGSELHRQCHPDQGEPDRHPHRDAGCHPGGGWGGLPVGDLPPVRVRREDTFIADLAVAHLGGSDQDGSAPGPTGLAKYNQLLRIAEGLGASPDTPARGSGDDSPGPSSPGWWPPRSYLRPLRGAVLGLPGSPGCGTDTVRETAELQALRLEADSSGPGRTRWRTMTPTLERVARERFGMIRPGEVPLPLRRAAGKGRMVGRKRGGGGEAADPRRRLPIPRPPPRRPLLLLPGRGGGTAPPSPRAFRRMASGEPAPPEASSGAPVDPTGRVVRHSPAGSAHPPPWSPPIRSRSGRKRSMGIGKRVVELFSAAISTTVWR